MNNEMLLAGFTQISLAERIKNKNSNKKNNQTLKKKNPQQKPSQEQQEAVSSQWKS